RTGMLDVQASQTVANYWLPPHLLRFGRRYPGITIDFEVGNSTEVAEAVSSGRAELGFIEGSIDAPALAVTPIARDRLIAVTGAATARSVSELQWVMREPGSGTRAVFEAAMRAAGIDPAGLSVALVLPTNESVLAAVLASDCATALSELVVTPFIHAGALRVLDFELPPRQFSLLRHKERRLSAAARRFEETCRAG